MSCIWKESKIYFIVFEYYTDYLFFFVLLLDKYRKNIQLKNENSLCKSWFFVLNNKSLIGFWDSSDIFWQLRNSKVVKLFIFCSWFNSFFHHLMQIPEILLSLIGLADHCLVTLEKMTLKRLSPCPVVGCSKEMPSLKSFTTSWILVSIPR